MDNNELTHWGIKGMRWGVRRFQNKDGSLTAAGRKRREIDDIDDEDDFVVGATNKGASKNNHDNDTESTEAKRERLLKSTNASELYKNRSLLTTAELNERLNRIDTERRLSEAAAKESKPKKTAIDKVNTILKYGNKINDIYNFTQTPVMKALKKKLFGPGRSYYLDKYLGDFIAIGIGNSIIQYTNVDDRDLFVFRGHHSGLTRAEVEVPLIMIERPKDNKKGK